MFRITEDFSAVKTFPKSTAILPGIFNACTRLYSQVLKGRRVIIIFSYLLKNLIEIAFYEIYGTTVGFNIKCL